MNPSIKAFLHRSCKPFALLVLVVSVLAFNGWWVWEDIARASVMQSLQRRITGQCGFVPRVCYQNNADDRRYLVYVPHVPPPAGKKVYPTIVFLNGRGECGVDGYSQISNNFGLPVWETQHHFPFFCIFPQCAINHHWNQPDHRELMLRIVDDVAADFPIDTTRIYLTGASAGSAAAVQFAVDYPDRFAGVFPVSCAGLTNDLAKEYGSRGIPIWQFFNLGDAQGLVTQSKSGEIALAETGASYRSTAYDRDGHDAWNYAFRDTALYAWLLRLPGKSAAANVAPYGLVQGQSVSLGNGLGEITWQADFDEPVGISVEGVGEVTLSAIGENFYNKSPTFANSSHSNLLASAGSLFARASIRPGQWNHLHMIAERHMVSVWVNGWPAIAWQRDQYPGTDEFSSPEFVGYAEGGVAPLRVSIDCPHESIRHLSSRSAVLFDTADEIVAGHDFFGPSAQVSKVVAAQPIIAFENSPQRSTITIENVREQLQVVSQRTRVKELQWKFTTRLNARSIDCKLSRNSALGVMEYQSWRVNLSPDVREPRERSGYRRASGFSRALANRMSIQQPLKFTPYQFRQWEEGGQFKSTYTTEDGDSLEMGDQPSSQTDTVLQANYWSRRTMDVQWTNQLDSLNRLAAQLSLGDTGDGSIDLELSQLQMIQHDGVPVREWVGERSCLLLRQRDENSGQERRIWYDPEHAGLICRYHGHVEVAESDFEFMRSSPLPSIPGDVLIEIHYDENDRPKGWTVVARQTLQGPIAIYGWATEVK